MTKKCILLTVVYFTICSKYAFCNIKVNNISNEKNQGVVVKTSNNTQSEDKMEKDSDDEMKDMFVNSDGNIITNIQDIPSLIETSGNWSILTGKHDGMKTCYAILQPFGKIGNHTDSRNSYLMVVYYSKSKQVINISMGFNFKLNSNVNISVDGRQFASSTNGNLVIPNPETTSSIVKSMLYSQKLLIKGDSRINTYAVDSYNIGDFQEIYYKLAKNCNMM